MRTLIAPLVLAGLALTACGTQTEPAPAHSYAPGSTSASASASTNARPAGDVRVSAAGATAATAARPTIDDGTRVLAIPAQGVKAAVLECGTEDGVVTPPPMVKDVCWWNGSRPLKSAEGVSIVVGHSTRSDSSTGALERTRELPIGSVLTLAGQKWKVESIETDVDKRGLPAWVTYTTGPRMLGLITCDLTNHASNVLVRLVPAA